MPTKLTPEIIAAAVEGLEARKVTIDHQIAELRAMLSGTPAETTAEPEVPTGKRKKFSAAARRRMAQAQKLRYARLRGEGAPTEPAAVDASKARPKRRISEEGMKRIIAATKKRWRLAREAKAQAGTTKKATPVQKKTTVKKAAPGTAE